MDWFVMVKNGFILDYNIAYSLIEKINIFV